MTDRTSSIFSNPISPKTVKKAEKSKKKYLHQFGDDTSKIYHLKPKEIPSLGFLNCQDLVLSEEPMTFEKNALVVGNIRMGFGHYRISIAIASCAKALGYKPYWFDLASFDATGSKMIRAQNDLYSKASRLSQVSHLFNHFFWEPLNSEGFKKITYNAKDQKNSELLAPLYHDFPADIPFIATHVWPSQGAIHAGLTHVVNAIPDNWPMGLHLSEGAIHTVQTPYAYFGYKTLNGFAKEPLHGMPEEDLYEVGHYVDHELVSNVEVDSFERAKRLTSGAPIRILISVGGAGAGANLFLSAIEHLLPYVKENKAAIFLSFGDHFEMWDYLVKNLPELKKYTTTYFDKYDKLLDFVKNANAKNVEGIYAVASHDIFEAVYETNLLMRVSDFLITKPSELAFYPIPKLFMRHIGGHEVYGAIHGREMGDSTPEAPDKKSLNQLLDTLFDDKDVLLHIIEEIPKKKKDGLYDGGYKAVKLAVEGRPKKEE